MSPESGSGNSEKVSYPCVKRLVNVTVEEPEIDQVVKVLLDAFEGDPFGLILLGGDLSLDPVFFRAHTRASLIGGEVHVISVGPETHHIVGTAMWYPPGSSPFDSEEQRAGGWGQFMKSIPSSLRSWWFDYFLPNEDKLAKDAFGQAGPKYIVDAWQLHFLAVMKSHHRKGFAKQLFETVDGKAKEAGVPIVVETTTLDNIKVYEKMGLHIRAETPVVSPFGEGRMRLMSSEP